MGGCLWPFSAVQCTAAVDPLRTFMNSFNDLVGTRHFDLPKHVQRLQCPNGRRKSDTCRPSFHKIRTHALGARRENGGVQRPCRRLVCNIRKALPSTRTVGKGCDEIGDHAAQTKAHQFQRSFESKSLQARRPDVLARLPEHFPAFHMLPRAIASGRIPIQKVFELLLAAR